MQVLEPHRRARLRADLAQHPRDARRFGRGLVVERHREPVEHGLRAERAQPQAELDVLPAVLAERLVEVAARRVEPAAPHGHVGGPEPVAAIVARGPHRDRQRVERFGVDRGAAHDDVAVALVRLQVLGREHRRRQHVVVDERDALAGAARDPGVARFREAAVALIDHGEPARRDPPRALDHGGRVVVRAVVHEHHLVRVGGDRLVEARFEHALQQARAVVGAELDREAH